MLSALVFGIGLFLFTLFTGFGRWDLGLGIAAVVVVPTVAIAWFDQWRLGRAVAAFRREHPSA